MSENNQEEQKIGFFRYFVAFLFIALVVYVVYNKMTTGN